MSNVAVAAPNPASFQATYWLALALTPGLGPTRIKKLIEQYGTAERVFHASLTELEATGMRAVSAQSGGLRALCFQVLSEKLGQGESHEPESRF